MEQIRLNKYISTKGVCSRREADRMIADGLVSVNGKIAQTGMKVTSEDTILVNGKMITRDVPFILLAVNKPAGILCSDSDVQGKSIVSLLNYPERIYPVGRLDKESEGLVLMTNQGDLVNRILRGANEHEKEYLVRLNKPVTDEFIEQMENGVEILDTVTKPCQVKKVARCNVRMILTQGLNRQIRRMCEVLGYRVQYLKRIRIMNIHLKDLKVGEFRKIEDNELTEFLFLLKDSDPRPYKEIVKAENIE